MLVFQQISIKSNANIFTQKDRRYIRFSYNKIASKSQNEAKIISEKEIKFISNISFPIVLNKQIEFQIYKKHQFGFDSEEFTNILKGKIIIQKHQKLKQSDVFNQNGQKIGILTAYFRTTSIIPQKAGKIMLKNQKFIIKSMIAHFSNIKKKRIYINIKIGDQNKQTSPVNSRGGELVFTERYELEKSSFVKEAIFEIFSLEPKNNQTKLLSTGILDLSEVSRKINLTDAKNESIGELFVEYHRVSTRQPKDLQTKQLKKDYATIDFGKLQKYKQKQTIRPKGIQSLYRNSNSDLISQEQKHTSSQLGLSKVSNSLSRIKKVSVLNNNNEIFFPKEKRFMEYKDKSSTIVSYLQNRSGFQFKEKHSGRFYRGASLGLGQKTDFAEKKNPGVGRYQLPSIWDRY